MKVIIVNCFDTYEDRIDLIYCFFMQKGYDVTVIQSDFRHFKKDKNPEKKQGFIYVESIPYYKNISIARLKSHYRFSKSAFDIVEKIEPDILYAIVPPNSIAKFAGRYKNRKSNSKLIFDLIDLWPETMPISNMKKYPPFSFWKSMRDKNLIYADCIITECDLYQDYLKVASIKGIIKTIHLAKKQQLEAISAPALSLEQIHLCYLGSINNLIDISKIKEIIRMINKNKKTILHIIGDGEKRDLLIEEIKSIGVTVEYHGEIYDVQRKLNIFDQCHFGLNIMKENVCVGLTMKSIDYFQFGLPILNNIQADTTEIVIKNNVGFNIKDNTIEEIGYLIANTSLQEFLEMRKRAFYVFQELFSISAFERKMQEMIKEL